MKAAIISDIHDNLINLKKCLTWCNENKLDIIICCGDICNVETLKYLADNFKAEIYLVRGNSEIYDEAEITKFSNINYLGRQGIFKIQAKKIGLCHEPWLADKILADDRPDIIFYGHSHKPFEEERESVRMINPGTLGGVFQKSTFAVWDIDSGELELKILEKI